MYLPKLPILKVGERVGSRSQQQSAYLECETIQSLIPNVLDLQLKKKKSKHVDFPTKYSNMDKHLPLHRNDNDSPKPGKIYF